jgi:hypothetical protein
LSTSGGGSQVDRRGRLKSAWSQEELKKPARPAKDLTIRTFFAILDVPFSGFGGGNSMGSTAPWKLHREDETNEEDPICPWFSLCDKFYGISCGMGRNRSSEEEHRVDAQALIADEGRGKLRKAMGSRKQA